MLFEFALRLQCHEAFLGVAQFFLQRLVFQQHRVGLKLLKFAFLHVDLQLRVGPFLLVSTALDLWADDSGGGPQLRQFLVQFTLLLFGFREATDKFGVSKVGILHLCQAALLHRRRGIKIGERKQRLRIFSRKRHGDGIRIFFRVHRQF